MNERILVTSALRYATGPVHIGHIAGAYLPADIYVRYQRLKGSDVIHIGGTDEYGVPLVVKAEQEGLTPQQTADKYHSVIQRCYDGLGIEFDNFSQTSRPIHTETSQAFFSRLLERGAITDRETSGLFCTNCDRSLPDRYVEGTCPHCTEPGARGDQCESCGRWLDATELIDPVCVVCGGSPEVRSSRHWFLKLGDFQDRLEQWIESHDDWRDNVKNFCTGWFKEGLRDRAITRDLQWGVPVPLEEAAGKVLYVWFDAPIGYISSTKEWAAARGEPDAWRDWWMNPNCRIVHFIGKDNVVFHAIVWPAMLMGHGEFELPGDIPANEFMNIMGEKFSSSRNLAIWVDDYLQEFPPDPLRYYIAANAPETKDADFTWREFQARNNGELADILGNFVNRSITFAAKHFDGAVPEAGPLDEVDRTALNAAGTAADKVGSLLESYNVRQATFEMLNLARAGNKYFNDQEPWKTRKSDLGRCATTINVSLQLCRALAVVFHPVLPFSTETLWQMLGCDGTVTEQTWESAGEPILPARQPFGKIEVLFSKIDDETVARQEAKLATISGEGDQ